MFIGIQIEIVNNDTRRVVEIIRHIMVYKRTAMFMAFS